MVLVSHRVLVVAQVFRKKNKCVLMSSTEKQHINKYFTINQDSSCFHWQGILITPDTCRNRYHHRLNRHHCEYHHRQCYRTPTRIHEHSMTKPLKHKLGGLNKFGSEHFCSPYNPTLWGNAKISNLGAISFFFIPFALI